MKAAAIVLALLMGACQRSGAERVVHVSAAISLKEPLTSLAHDFEGGHPGVKVQLSLGASGELATQIEHGAEADLFASAAAAPANKLVVAGKATPRCTIARNALVMIRRPDPALAQVSWETIASSSVVSRVALGLSPSVPAGTYAEETLGKLGALAPLGPKIVRATNVRQVLDLVARGEADVGFVYATDVVGRSDVIVVGEPPASARPDITYPLVAAADASPDARAFAESLCGDAGRAALARAGFLPP